MTKQVKLLMDEFHPNTYRTHEMQFWMLPQPVAADKSLSQGAKLLYAVLFGLARNRGTAFARQDTLGSFISKSTRMVNRYQNELVNAGLIRVLQKGKGLPNNYYLLRHPMLGNAAKGEFEPGARPLYRNRQAGTQTIVTEDEGKHIYEDMLRDWYEASCRGEYVEFPKPGIKLPSEVRKEMEAKWRQQYLDAVVAGEAVISLPGEELPSTHSAGVEELRTESTTAPLDYDAVFDSDSSDTRDTNPVLKLSNKPSELRGPHGDSIIGPSSRELYEAAMKRKQAYTQKMKEEGHETVGVPDWIMKEFNLS